MEYFHGISGNLLQFANLKITIESESSLIYPFILVIFQFAT